MFCKDLKELMRSSVGADKQMVFLFHDAQIIDERFLEDTNSIINSCEVLNLFTDFCFSIILLSVLCVCSDTLWVIHCPLLLFPKACERAWTQYGKYIPSWECTILFRWCPITITERHC